MLNRADRKTQLAPVGRIVAVASEYNRKYVDGMLGGAREVLGDIEVIRVPGAFEIPMVASLLARRNRRRPSAVICLGVILRGDTSHADHIGATVSALLGQISVETGVPIIHEVLLLENVGQAKKRCLNKKTNRGSEAALTALSMGHVLKSMKYQSNRK